MNIQRAVWFESEVLPGVRYKLRRMTEREATEIRLSLAEAVAELQQVEEEGAKLRKENPCLEDEGADLDAIEKLSVEDRVLANNLVNRTWSAMAQHIMPAWIRAGLMEIENLEFDGVPADIETFLTEVEDDAVVEVHNELERLCGLDAEERKNFESPSTSTTAVDGATNGLAAPNAAPSATTPKETAPDTSPPSSTPIDPLAGVRPTKRRKRPS